MTGPSGSRADMSDWPWGCIEVQDGWFAGNNQHINQPFDRERVVCERESQPHESFAADVC